MSVYYAQGAYLCEVIDQGLSLSSNGNHQIWLQVNVRQPLSVGCSVERQFDRTIFWTLTDNTIDYVLDKLERLGFHGESFRLLDPAVAGHQSFVGQQIECYCEIEVYNGKQKEKWDLNSPLRAAPEPLGADEARKLDALFGQKLKGRFKRSGAVPAATVANGKPAIASTPTVTNAAPVAASALSSVPVDDDIPF